MSDTSLVFNLVAREQVSETLGKVKEKFDAAATGIAAGVGVALGYGVAQSMDMSAANAKLAAQLGVGPAEAAKLSKVSADVYANNWGESTEQVNEAIKGVYQNIGDVSKVNGGLEGVTSKALALAQTFDQEVGPTTAAVGQMLKTGLAKNADEAFDILTRGFQTGANKADDLLDTVNEYGVQWKKFGLDGQTAMGLLSQGLKGGARDADLVADSIKEFSIRAIDGSTASAQGFKMLGLDAKKMAATIGQGGKGATAALDETLDRLRNIKDPVKQAQAATALFGTQAEDLGQALYKLDPSTAVTALGKVGGAADKMSKTVSDSPAAALETFKRQATVKLAEVGGVFVQFAMDNKGAFGPLAAVLGTVAAAILAVSVAQRIYATYTAIASAAQTIWNSTIWASTAALLANPMTWIVLAIIALIAVIVIIATKTTWFQTIWTTVWGAIRTAFAATVKWLSGAFSWFGTLPGKFASWFGSAKDWVVRKLGETVLWVAGLPGRINNALANMGAGLWNTASNAFQNLKTAALIKALSLVTWMQGLPGRLVGALGSQAYRFYNMGLDFVRGIWDGISAMGGWLWSKISNFASDYIIDPVTNFLDIGSPSKRAADEIGHWLPEGIAMGAQDNAGVVDEAMRGLVDPAAYRPTAQTASSLAPLAGANSGGAAANQLRVLFEFVGGSRAFREFFQESVRTTAGGDVVKFAGG
ncbi:phage tail tape measure protein [Streptomyces turgidiscabies]|uniref:phage tail tape measure protein n=1 Tax=Streptomyces turgidiscabies TaxID=85558 RepID=UPI0029B9A2A6|nr:phage tail tape measure protein [Streptomyces turgidiscabies]MDX3497191.1 phage tail tape measure protein [Streptomyces turgidiscabies]